MSWILTSSYGSWRRNTILWLVVENGVEVNPKRATPPSPVKWILQLIQQRMAQRSLFVGIVAKLGTPFTNVQSPRMTSELNLITTNEMPWQTQYSPNLIQIHQAIHLLNGIHPPRVKIIYSLSMVSTCFASTS